MLTSLEIMFWGYFVWYWSDYCLYFLVKQFQKDRMSSMLTFSNLSFILFVLKVFADKNKSSIFYENVFNSAGCLICGCFYLSIKECISLVWLMCNWDIVICSSLDFLKPSLQEFIVDVVIPASLLFCMKESLNFRFQVSIWNLEFIGRQL